MLRKHSYRILWRIVIMNEAFHGIKEGKAARIGAADAPFAEAQSKPQECGMNGLILSSRRYGLQWW